VVSTEMGPVKQATNAEKQTVPKRYGLDAMFAPGSVAVIGATGRSGTVGRTILENLLHGGFQGKVYAVNAKLPEVLGSRHTRAFVTSPEEWTWLWLPPRQRRSRSSLESAWNPGPSPRL
jgi:hypothetical protein